MALNPEIFTVHSEPRGNVRDFIETHHYSRSINGVKSSYCFSLRHSGEMIGAALYGEVATRNQWVPYGSSEKAVLELRRLVLIDDTPRNAESYFIARTLKWLRKNTAVESVVSYADPHHGHEGIVYKASNFTLVGKSSPTKVVKWGNREYHDRAMRTKYNGVLKPFAQRLVDAVASGEAYMETRPPKNIYLYRLRRQSESLSASVGSDGEA